MTYILVPDSKKIKIRVAGLSYIESVAWLAGALWCGLIWLLYNE